MSVTLIKTTHSNNIHLSSSDKRQRECIKKDVVEEGIFRYLQQEAQNSAERRVQDPDELWLLSLLPPIKRLNNYQKGEV